VILKFQQLLHGVWVEVEVGVLVPGGCWVIGGWWVAVGVALQRTALMWKSICDVCLLIEHQRSVHPVNPPCAHPGSSSPHQSVDMVLFAPFCHMLLEQALMWSSRLQGLTHLLCVD